MANGVVASGESRVGEARGGAANGGERPAVHVRAIVIQPTSPLGKLALSAVLIVAGVLFFTVGIALAVGLATAATVVGGGVIAYRAIRGKRVGMIGLDPRKEIRPGSADRSKLKADS